MAIENAQFISELDKLSPLGSDSVGQADDHIRLTKAVLKNSFPNVAGRVDATHTDLNKLIRRVPAPVTLGVGKPFTFTGEQPYVCVIEVTNGAQYESLSVHIDRAGYAVTNHEIQTLLISKLEVTNLTIVLEGSGTATISIQ